MAKDIAKYMYPIADSNNKSEKQIQADKGYAYQRYKRALTSLSHVLEKASPNYVSEQMMLRNRKDRAFQYTKEQRQQLLNAPPSSYVTNPEPEPGKEDTSTKLIHTNIFILVVPCSLEELSPLLDHLKLNGPGPIDDKQSVVFTRGAIMSGGRLDLCKQVVGPQGIQPLLNAMKHSSIINRLLLGNLFISRIIILYCLFFFKVIILLVFLEQNLFLNTFVLIVIQILIHGILLVIILMVNVYHSYVMH